jgi:hypothetical protein
MSRHFPWSTLGIDATQDISAIRRAYANALRGLNVDEDIAGYANLRRARDEALWLAAQGDSEEDAGDYGLGGLDDDPLDQIDPDTWAHCDTAPALSLPDPLPDATAPDQIDAQARAQDAWQALLDILYPGGEVSEESVTYAEMEQGLTHLAVLLDHAECADLAEHDALDGALADAFARTWPRSAPFVEPANAALHWLEEAGQLEERPALMFLNARLKGMRFHEKVQQPCHPLHKAWTELSRPGRAGFTDRLRLKRLDIDKLLTGLRQHYPELESHLAPERIASWEGSTNASGVSDTGPKVVRGIFIALLVLAVPRLIASFTDPRPDAANAPAVSLFDNEPSPAEVDAEVSDIFGTGVGMAAVRAADPVFADQLRSALNVVPFSDSTPLVFVRNKALGAGEIADFEALVIRAELRRLWYGAALRQPIGVCQNVLVGDFFSIPLELTSEERVTERALLSQLLKAQVLRHEAKGGKVQYTIPGWVVRDVISRTGFDEESVRKAMDDMADDNRCKVETALADIVLANPGRVSKELLCGL